MARHTGEAMSTLLYTDPRFADHDMGPTHPECPARLSAVLDGLATSGVSEDVVVREPRFASLDEMSRVHDRAYLESIRRLCDSGGGRIDADTAANAATWRAAALAAGSGLAAVEALRAGEADHAFCAVRPPGHHATPSRAMGFCFVNNVAVAAAALADAGERVAIIDIDAHHGNGTQDAFWDDPAVAYASIHQYPMYPGSGAVSETGGAAAPGGICNVPVPATTAGDTYRAVVDDVLAPWLDRMAPTWLLISTGFDAHRADPLTRLGLSAGDYGDLTTRLLALAPASRTVVFLEGGYDLDAVARPTASTLAALAGAAATNEAVTTGQVPSGQDGRTVPVMTGGVGWCTNGGGGAVGLHS